MAAADIHGTDIKVNQRVEVVSGADYKKRGKVTSVGSSVVNIDPVGNNIASNLLRVLEHGELGPITSGDWASTQ